MLLGQDFFTLSLIFLGPSLGFFKNQFLRLFLLFLHLGNSFLSHSRFASSPIRHVFVESLLFLFGSTLFFDTFFLKNRFLLRLLFPAQQGSLPGIDTFTIHIVERSTHPSADIISEWYRALSTNNLISILTNTCISTIRSENGTARRIRRCCLCIPTHRLTSHLCVFHRFTLGFLHSSFFHRFFRINLGSALCFFFTATLSLFKGPYLGLFFLSCAFGIDRFFLLCQFFSTQLCIFELSLLCLFKLLFCLFLFSLQLSLAPRLILPSVPSSVYRRRSIGACGSPRLFGILTERLACRRFTPLVFIEPPCVILHDAVHIVGCPWAIP